MFYRFYEGIWLSHGRQRNGRLTSQLRDSAGIIASQQSTGLHPHSSWKMLLCFV